MTLKCAHSATLYDIVEVKRDRAVLSDVCDQDPKFYQACGMGTNDYAKSNSLLCGQFICNKTANGQIESSQCKPGGDDGQCSNTHIEDICTNMNLTSFCDETCDSETCEDEANCNGLQYGKYCQKENFYMDMLSVAVRGYLDYWNNCDLWKPYDRKSQFLLHYSGNTCHSFVTGSTVPIFNFTRCGVYTFKPSVVDDLNAWWINTTHMAYCSNLMDQTNCSDPTRVAMSCKVNGYSTNISKFIICHGRQGVAVCDDGIENNCRTLSPSCHDIHKHRLCDGVSDCADSSDERNFECKERVNATCVRVYGNKNVSIPLSWLGDGTMDCISGEDELENNWPTCGSGQTLRYVISNKSCTDDFLCMNSEIKFIPQSQLCDKIDTCGNENQICSLSRGEQELHTKMLLTHEETDGILAFAYCLKGLDSIQRLQSNCTKRNFRFPKVETFGIKPFTNVITTEKLVDCDYTFGEAYLLLSCVDKCQSADSKCPLIRPLLYDSCSRQYPNRIYTISNNDYLTFVTPFRGQYRNNYFLCKNNGCVSYQQVCDLVDDCGDGSDEELCTNHFSCSSTATMIPKWRKCDGKIDCEDLSDECNEDCGKEIIEGVPLKVSSWCIGSLAVIFNVFIIFENVKSLKEASTSTGLLNKICIIFISIGDLLVGGYLFAISIFDQTFGSAYCLNQTEWLSSSSCYMLGIFSTFGSQLSLFSMTCLSLTRLFGIKNAMRFGDTLSWKSYIRIITVLGAVLGTSAWIAVSPMISRFEDFFVNGVQYEKSNPMFSGHPGKKVHMQIIQAYYGRTKSKSDPTSVTWKAVFSLIDGMFSAIYGGILRKNIHFYGNDGVCLFKYFVAQDDPQRMFSWSLLSINFFCFLIISASYLYINLVSTRSSTSVKAKNSRQANSRNKRMQRKISIIIATDFCCWVPFVLICCLHSVSVLDATPWYALFSVVILPINSVINPLLYDNSLTQFIIRPFHNLLRFKNTRGRMKRTITQQMTLGATTRSPHHRPCENKNKNDNLHDTDLDPIEKQKDNLAKPNGCIASDIVDTGV